MIGSSPHWPGGTGISNLRPLAGWISALERGRFQGHKQKRELKSVAPFARNQKLESISLQRRVSSESPPAAFVLMARKTREAYHRTRRARASFPASMDAPAVTRQRDRAQVKSGAGSVSNALRMARAKVGS